MAEITQSVTFFGYDEVISLDNRDEEGNLTNYAGETSAPENPDTETIETVKTLIRNGVDNKITKGYIQAYPKKFVDVTGDSEVSQEEIGDVQGEFMSSNPNFTGVGANQNYIDNHILVNNQCLQSNKKFLK